MTSHDKKSKEKVALQWLDDVISPPVFLLLLAGHPHFAFWVAPLGSNMAAVTQTSSQNMITSNRENASSSVSPFIKPYHHRPAGLLLWTGRLIHGGPQWDYTGQFRFLRIYLPLRGAGSMSQRGGWLLEWRPLGLLIGLVLGRQARGRVKSRTLPAVLPSVCWAPSAGPRDHRVGIDRYLLNE